MVAGWESAVVANEKDLKGLARRRLGEAAVEVYDGQAQKIGDSTRVQAVRIGC
jgi:hypothetical protein